MNGKKVIYSELAYVLGIIVLALGTAVFYGITLDLMIRIVGMIPSGIFTLRILSYVLGMILCAIGVSLLFHTYISPEAYELFVKEISANYGKDINKTKTVYDCCSCFLSILLSFVFFGFGHFKGVNLGTILCAVMNGTLIVICSKILETKFYFQDALRLRRYFA